MSYQICTRCVMDTSDPDITFDKDGVCNHCHTYDEMVRRYVHDGSEGLALFNELASKIRHDGVGKQYDCVIGVSGGVDSAYALLKAVKDFYLRPLVLHLDNGWNSELAVHNIKKMVNHLKLDLHTLVLDWEEFKDLQLAFLKAGVPDLEIPTDFAITAFVLKTAHKLGVKYALCGNNVRTESHLPKAWSQGHKDWLYVKSIHKQYGNVPLKTYPKMNLLQYAYFHKTIQFVYILNYLEYNKVQAMNELKGVFDWFEYEGKHCESIYTRFYQRYILPIRFGYDKRRSHFSSLICSGQITREEALKRLELFAWSFPVEYPTSLTSDFEYVAKKFGYSGKTFYENFIDNKNHDRTYYNDYPNYAKFLSTPFGRNTIGRVFRDRMKVL